MRFGVYFQHILAAAGEQKITLPEMLAHVRTMGFSHVNMDCREASPEVLKALDDAGIQVWEIYDNFRFAEDPEDFNDFRLIRIAEMMRSTHLLPVPGLYSGDPEKQAQELDNMVTGLKRFVEEASKHGMICGMEDYDHLRSPIRTIDGIRYFQERIPELKTFFDTGNFFISGEDAMEAFEAFRHNIVSVHLKDRTLEKNAGMPKTRTDGSLMYPAAVGYGIMPVEKVIRELDAAGYDGVFTAEFFDTDSYTRDMELTARFFASLK